MAGIDHPTIRKGAQMTDGPLPETPFEALFLGPAAENADLFERFILEALRDHVFWRRNFHPEDGPHILEAQRRSERYDATIARLRQELYSLLSRLKQAAPFFSPRYIAHMTSDVTLAGLVGYFAAMLYNPNNISEEAAPATTDMEQVVATQLARLVGYGDGAWGHLASGGTVANLEALWALRGLKYFAPGAALALRAHGGIDLSVRRGGGQRAHLTELTAWELMNLPGETILGVRDDLIRLAREDDRLEGLLASHSLSELGMTGFHRCFAEEWREPLPEPIILVPATRHYSWPKIADLLGLGRGQLCEVPLDEQDRMDPLALAQRLAETQERQVPILALIAVMGTTESGSVDELHRLAAAREAAAERGLAFPIHVDAAYGGYATTMFRDASGGWTEGPSAGLAERFRALAQADSITIDPHKLGYAPYPAGALLLRDRRIREFLAIAAPYAFHEGPGEPAAPIGPYIVEGSRPGAAAASVWLAHRVLPLDDTGYGALIGRTVGMARALHRAIASYRGTRGARLIPLNDPDLNLVTFLAVPPGPPDLERINRFNEALFRRFAVTHERPVYSYEFLLSKTTFDVPRHRASLESRLDEPLWSVVASGSHLTVLRATVMNPFALRPDEPGDFTDLLAALEEAMASEILTETASNPARPSRDPARRR
jgi:glutamate/tyrosine decarboxylase-like PLP-dependent enzyme